MNVTVIICSYDRCDRLAIVLESIALSTLPGSVEWEVLVVDNNSHDETRMIVENFCRRYPHFRYVLEPQPGKSYALNTGIRQAHGNILAFVDDDVVVDPDWLWNLTAPLHGDSEWAGTGGRTLPAQHGPIPPWLSLNGPYSLGGAIAALFDLGELPCQLDSPPYGANMAFRRKMFRRYGGFRLDMGPSPCKDVLRPNEDTEFGRRLMSSGERLLYVPSAVVYHPLLVERIKKEYLLSWWFDYGRAVIREVGRRRDLYGIPRRYFTIAKTVATTLARRTLQWIFAFDPQRRFFCKCSVWTTAGQIWEIHHRWRGDQSTSNGAEDPVAPSGSARI
jgi:glycosyltransferase involved in cell wall biosynthesis